MNDDDEDDLISLDHVAEPAFGMQVRGPVAMRTHGPAKCRDDPACCIHKPSAHPLVSARLNWRGDLGLMERICRHGVGHPDPDDIAHKERDRGPEYAWAMAVHGCDGCCRD